MFFGRLRTDRAKICYPTSALPESRTKCLPLPIVHAAAGAIDKIQFPPLKPRMLSRNTDSSLKTHEIAQFCIVFPRRNVVSNRICTDWVMWSRNSGQLAVRCSCRPSSTEFLGRVDKFKIIVWDEGPGRASFVIRFWAMMNSIIVFYSSIWQNWQRSQI